MPNWYLCQTKARDENRAKVNLERQGYRVNVPTLDGAALFPGYIFIQVDDKPFSPINSTRGVISLIQFGGQLAIVPSSVVTELEQTEWTRSEECAPGSQVIVNSGSFKYMPAIVEAKKGDRIIVLMNILQSKQRLEFPMKDVVAA